MTGIQGTVLSALGVIIVVLLAVWVFRIVKKEIPGG